MLPIKILFLAISHSLEAYTFGSGLGRNLSKLGRMWIPVFYPALAPKNGKKYKLSIKLE